MSMTKEHHNNLLALYNIQHNTNSLAGVSKDHLSDLLKNLTTCHKKNAHCTEQQWANYCGCVHHYHQTYNALAWTKKVPYL
eukprot:3316838-Amphidinium_carterae.2